MVSVSLILSQRVEALASVTDLVDLNGASAAAGALVGAGTMGGAAYDMVTGVGDEFLMVTDIASASALETALELGGTFAITTNGTAGTGADMAAGDAFLVAYDNGVSTTIAVVATTAGAGDNATFASGDLTVTDLITLTGITDSETIAATDLVLIA